MLLPEERTVIPAAFQDLVTKVAQVQMMTMKIMMMMMRRSMIMMMMRIAKWQAFLAAGINVLMLLQPCQHGALSGQEWKSASSVHYLVSLMSRRTRAVISSRACERKSVVRERTGVSEQFFLHLIWSFSLLSLLVGTSSRLAASLLFRRAKTEILAGGFKPVSLYCSPPLLFLFFLLLLLLLLNSPLKQIDSFGNTHTL